LHINKTEPGQAAAPQEKPTQQAAKPVPQSAAKAPQLPSVPRSAASLAASSGLGADKLSAYIISFAKFFSLPIKPELMTEIRRQAMMQSAQQPAPQTTEAQTETVKPAAQDVLKNRAALSLAAAAAESKGVELQPKGLESYAEAVDPDRKRQDGGEHKGRRDRNREQKEAVINASSLKETALAAAEKDPLLYLLNRLPGKDGRRWIVLPFDFTENGREYFVSMRILLDGDKAANRASCMALDIVETPAGDNTPNRRLFVWENAAGRITKLSVYTNDKFPQRELAALLDIPVERVFVKPLINEDSFPCETGGGEDMFLAVDKAV
jgi:hypothetical protein